MGSSPTGVDLFCLDFSIYFKTTLQNILQIHIFTWHISHTSTLFTRSSFKHLNFPHQTHQTAVVHSVLLISYYQLKSHINYHIMYLNNFCQVINRNSLRDYKLIVRCLKSGPSVVCCGISCDSQSDWHWATPVFTHTIIIVIIKSGDWKHWRIIVHCSI